MTTLARRVELLEEQRKRDLLALQQRMDAAYSRIVRNLDDETLDAILGCSEAWAALSDAEVRAIGDGTMEPPPEIVACRPLDWAMERVMEAATPEERNLFDEWYETTVRLEMVENGRERHI